MLPPQQQERRLAFFFWEGYLGVAPSLLNAIQLLSQHGYRVDIFLAVQADAYSAPPPLPANVTAFSLDTLGVRIRRLFLTHKAFAETNEPKGEVTGATRWNKSTRQLAAFILKIFSPVRSAFLAPIDFLLFLRFCRSHVRCNAYFAFFGIDMYGLAAARLLAPGDSFPLIFWSLELAHLRNFWAPFPRLRKKMEMTYSRRAVATIIQDGHRLDALQSENGVQKKPIVVPNAPLGLFAAPRSRFFQEKFSLSDRSAVILHIGLLSPEVLADDIASACANWQDDLCLVFHERQTRSPDDPYIIKLMRRSNGRALFSLEPVPYDRLDQVVSSGDIGLLFYDKTLGTNFALAGSSGKLGHYLKCGLPIIALDLPGVREIIAHYRCGIVVSSAREIADAANVILSDYSEYSTRALQCGRECYEFGRHFEAVLALLAQLPTESR